MPQIDSTELQNLMSALLGFGVSIVHAFFVLIIFLPLIVELRVLWCWAQTENYTFACSLGGHTTPGCLSSAATVQLLHTLRDVCCEMGVNLWKSEVQCSCWNGAMLRQPCSSLTLRRLALPSLNTATGELAPPLRGAQSLIRKDGPDTGVHLTWAAHQS